MAEPNSGMRTIRIVLWIAVVAAAAGLFWMLSNRNQRPTTVTSTNYAASLGGPFTLVDPSGRTVTDESLKGEPFAIFFGYTRCPDVCPTTLAKLAKWKKAMGPDGDKFRILFVSLDPEHDTPSDIGNYVDLFGVPITGLTGSPAQLEAIVKDYHVYYEKVPSKDGDFTIDHSATVFLMDRNGKLKSTIDMAENDEAAKEKLEALVG